MASSTKEKVAKALAEVKKENEDFDFNIFESGDFLQLLEVTNKNSGDSQKKPDGEDEQPEPEQDEPKIDDEPDDLDEPDAPDKPDDPDDDKGKDKKPKNRELRVGDKVRVKSTGREGVITQINDDGTYVVSDDVGEQFADGGEIIKFYNDGGEIGTYVEDELEIISEDPETDEDPDTDDDPDDDGDPDDQDPDSENPDKKGKKKKKKDGDPDTDGDPDDPDTDGDPDDPDDPDDDPDPNAPPKQPRPVDIDEIKRLYRKIRSHTFKLPLFAKTFFNADLNSQLFYDEQSPMVLFNRSAKDVLNPKKNISLEDATSVLKFNLSYLREHVPFMRQYLEYIPDANRQMVYMINIQKKFVLPTTFGDGLEVSLQMIEQMIDSDPDLAQIIMPILLLLEKTIVNDNFYYRILSLSAVLNPEYFSQNYLKTHLDFLRKYFYSQYLTFCNQENIFTDVDVMDSLIYDTARDAGNLLVINIIGSDNFDEDYTLYICRNIISITGEKIQIDRILLTDAIENDRLVMVKNLTAFYVYSMYLKSNSNTKKTILRNMKKFGTLQEKSYGNFLTNIQILTFNI